MKSFFINLLFALLIAAFVYFVVAGKSVSDLVSKETWKKAEDNKVVKTLRDNVLSPPSATSSDETIFERARSLGKSLVSGGGATSTATSTDGGGGGPLSKLLNDYADGEKSGEEETATSSSVEVEKSATSSEEKSSESQSESEKVKAKLPEFDLICMPEFKQICSASGCERKQPGTFFSLIDEGGGQIYNCISGECSGFGADKNVASSSVNYSFVGSKGNVHLLSRKPDSEDKKAYVELVTKGAGTEIYYGHCR